MTKKKNPTKTAEKNLTPVEDPRDRMKEIRAMVLNHVNGKAVNEDLGYLPHLGNLPDTMADARRVIVAIQDLHEDERMRHRKATQHICSMVHIIEEMGEYQMELLEHIDQLGRENRQLREYLGMAEKQHTKITKEMRQSQQERDAVLLTMKLLNGQQPQSASVNMVVGYSNKDQF